MRKLVVIIGLFCSLFANSQSETNDFVTYDTLLGTFNLYTWQARITRPVNYFTPNHPDTASRPVLLFMPGQGEANSNYAGLQSYGGHYWLNNGWDGSIVTGNGTHYPLIITVKPTAANPRINSAINMITALFNKFHPKTNSRHFAGLSMGGFTWGGMVNGQLTAGGKQGMQLMTSLVLLQGDGQGATAGIMGAAIPYDATGYTAFGHWASQYGGTLLGLEGSADTRNIWQPRDNMEDSVPGSAYFAYENIGGGTHCCWNTMYDPSRRNWKNQQADLGTNIVWNTSHTNTMGTYVNGWNVFEWMFRQGDTSLVGGGNIPPSVNAGSDISITLPVSSTTLIGTATDGDGTIASIQWSQISGPSSATIVNENSVQTDITGLQQGIYIFQLLATDDDGDSGSDQVQVTVNANPTVNPSPSGKKIVGPGEYQSYFIDPTGYLWGIGNLTNIGNGNTGTLGVAYRASVTPSDLKFKMCAGGLHGGAAVDTAGYVWVMGDNDQWQHGIGNNTHPIYTPSRISQDSAGNLFTDVRSVTAYFVKDGGLGYNGFYAIKNDSTLWGWGIMIKGMRGDGTAGDTIPRPVQIDVDGKKVVQVVAGQFVMVLCSDSTVYTWGEGVSSANLGYVGTTAEKWYPHQLPLTSIKQIAGGMLWNFALDRNSVLYGWGSYGERMGNPNGLPIATPTVLSNITNNLPTTISKIVTNSAVTHAVLADSTLWGWGDNGQGTVGNGQRIVFTLTPGSNPFDRNNLDVVVPVQIAKGIKFDTIFGGSTYTYHSYARDVNDSLYCWGRGKGAVLANWLRPASSGITATYGNSWDIAYPTPVDPFNISTSYIQTSDYCVKVDATGNPCNQYTIPSNTAPTADAGSTQNLSSVDEADLDGTGSTDDVYISRYQWSQVSGPTTAIIDLPASPTPTARNLTDGSYVFQLLVEDNGWLLDSTTVTVNVNTSPNQLPIISSLTSSADTIQLPTSSIKLTTVATDPDGTIEQYAYTLFSGPGGAGPSFLTPTLDTCTIYDFTVSGTYIFRVTVTDDDGGESFQDITIVVLPVSASGAAMKYRVNIYGGTNPILTDNWNNWNTTAGGINNIIDTTGAETNINATISSQLSVLTNTLVTGVMCPDTVLLYTSYSTGARTITLSGLEADALYTIEFYCSRTSGNSYTTIGQAGNDKQVLVLNNTTNTIEFTDMTPTTNQISFNLSGAPHYVNGFTLTRQGTETPVNTPPIANAGADSTITFPTDSVTLIGSNSSDPDGTIVSYQWVLQSSEYPMTFEDSTAADTKVYDLQVGVYSFQLTVTDNNGDTGSDSVQVIVLPEEADTPRKIRKFLRGFRLKGRN